MNQRRFFGGAVSCLLILSICFGLFAEVASANESIRKRIKIRKKIRLQRSEVDESEEYNREKRAVLDRQRQKLILEIKRFVRESRDNRQKAELNLRLGALYLEEYYARLADSQEGYDLQMKQWEESGKKGRAPKFDNSEAIASLDRARGIYKDLVKRYRKHSRRDEMLYFLALTSMDRGKISEGMRYFKAISVETPKSKYVNDALVQLGDHYFDNNKFKQAEVYYNKLIAKKYQPLLPYSMYKKGWCAYNGQRTEESLKLFKWVIENEPSFKEAPVRVRNEAIKDITLPFADLKMVNEAIAFFRQFGNPNYRNGVTTLASLLYEQGTYPQAIKAYTVLLGMDRNYLKNPEYDISIVRAYMQMEKRSEAVNHLFTQLPNYMKNSTWYELNVSRPDVIKSAIGSFEEVARSYAKQIHAEAQKTKNKNLYELAKLLYRRYIQYFPTSEHASEIRFFLAEILFKKAEYVEAAQNYYEVYQDKSSKHRLDGIRYALTSLDRQLNIDRKKQGLGAIDNKSRAKLNAKADAKLEKVPYTPVETTFIQIANEYLNTFPKQKDAPDVLYEAAYLKYVHHELIPAYKAFWILVQKYPSHETSMSSAYLILDILNRSDDYPKLIAACKQFLKTPSFTRKSFRDEVSDVLRKAELKRIYLAEKEGKYRVAADNYLEFTKVYGPQDLSLFEKALYNASVNYTRAEEPLLAVETQEKFLRRFPKSNLVKNMLLQVAKTYESLANFDKAARYFQEFASNHPTDPQSRSALRLAGLYFWGAGNSAKGSAVLNQYLARYPKDRALVQRDLVDLHEAADSPNERRAFYLQARAARGLSYTDYLSFTLKLAELEGQMQGRIPAKRMQEALAVVNSHRNALRQSPDGTRSLAKVEFWYVSQKDAQFRNIKLTLPQAALERNLQRKLSVMKDLEKQYSRVASLGSGEWGIASIYQTAAAYRHMAQAVLAAPVPGELNGEQLEMYRKELNRQMIEPFNEKALSLAEQCLDKSQELNIMSGWTSQCYNIAGELRRDRYPLARSFFIPPTQLALIVPRDRDTKMSIGDVKSYAYPFYSSNLFTKMRDVSDTKIPELYGATAVDKSVSPSSIDYQLLSDERNQILKVALRAAKPSNPRKEMSFAYLNLLRLVAPKKAIPEIKEQLTRNAGNDALHNLLALAFLESGNLAGAKVTWLSMVARGVKSATIWNNLGVTSYLQGSEDQAVEYFQEAILMEKPVEALTNLGFIALKYRNGVEAKKQFTRTLEIDRNNAPTQVGMAVAELQNRQWERAKEDLIGLAKRYKSDPYARLSLGYYLIDVEKESGIAGRVISDYIEQQSIGNDRRFRRALQEARQIASSGVALPEID